MEDIRILLNGHEVDFDKSTFKIVFQGFEVGKIDSVKTTYTKDFKLLPTEKTMNALHGLGHLNIQSVYKYKKLRADIYLGGFHLISNGVAQINKANYNKDLQPFLKCQINSSSIGLKSKIKGKTLQDLDLSFLGSENINFNNLSSVEKFMSKKDKYCFPTGVYINQIQENGTIKPIINGDGNYLQNSTGTDIFPKRLPIHFYTKWLVEKITQEAGYSSSIEVVEGSDKEVINTSYPLSLAITQNTSFAEEKMHPIKQDVFIKDFINRYGYVVFEKNKTIQLKPIKRILKGDYGILDWSDKFVSLVDGDDGLKGYGRNNTIDIQAVYSQNAKKIVTYEGSNYVVPVHGWDWKSVNSSATTGHYYWDVGEHYFTTNSMFSVNNETIEGKKTLFKWIYEYVINQAFESPNKTHSCAVNFMWGYESNIVKQYKNVPPRIFNVQEVKFNDSEFRPLKIAIPSNSYTTVQPQVYNVLKNDKTHPRYFFNTYWSEWIRMIRNYQKYNVLFNLSFVDILLFDVSKLIRVKQLGGQFAVNKLEYSLGNLSKVELIKIS